MKDPKKVKQNMIIVFVITMVYVIMAWWVRGYYAVGLEMFAPLWLFVAWLYADYDKNA